MPLEVSCPACGHHARIPDQFIGREVTCPKCPMQFIAGNVQAPPLLAPAPGLASEVVPVAAVVPEVLPMPRPPHPGFWWAVLWCLGILLVTQFVPLVVGVIILVVGSANRLKPETLMDTQALVNSPEYAQAMLPAMLLSQVLSIGSAWLAIRLIVGKDWPRILALRWPGWSHLVLALLGLPGLMVITIGVDSLAKRVFPSLIDLDQTMALFGKWPWPLGVLVIGLGPGIGEELWFRAFFGRGIVSRHGVIGGILLTSLLFGLIHLEPRQVAYGTIVGILLHLSYLATRSLLVPVILHTANNSLSILAMRVPALAAIDVPPEQLPWSVYGTAVLVVAAVGWAFYKSQPFLVVRPGSDASPRWPAFPSVEYPPLGTAIRVLHPSPSWTSWMLVIASVVLFAWVVVPAARGANERARQERETERKAPAVPSAQEVTELFRREPLSAEAWPGWSRRLRKWLGDTSDNTNAAYSVKLHRTLIQRSAPR